MNGSCGQGDMPSHQEQQLSHLGGTKGDGDPPQEAPAIHKTLQQQENNQQSVVPEQETIDVAVFKPETPHSLLSIFMPCGRGLKFWKEPKKPSSGQDLQSLPTELILLILEEAAYSAPGTLHSTLRVSRFMRELSFYVIRHKLASRLHPDYYGYPFETYLGVKSEWDYDEDDYDYYVNYYDDGSNGNGSNGNGSNSNDSNGNDSNGNGSNDTEADSYGDNSDNSDNGDNGDNGDVEPLVFMTQASIPYFFQPLNGSAHVRATYEFKGDWVYGDDPDHTEPGPWLGMSMGIPMSKQYIPVPRYLVASKPRDVAAWLDPTEYILFLDWRPFIMRMLYLLWVRERKERRTENGVLRRVRSWLSALAVDVGNPI